MNARFRQITTVLMVTFILAGCHRVEPIYNVDNNPVSVDTSHKIEQGQVGKIIAGAAISNGWTVEKIKSGELRVTKQWGSFSEVCSILYSDSAYSIEFVSATNLDQKDGKIHHKYNEHVKALQKSINNKLAAESL